MQDEANLSESVLLSEIKIGERFRKEYPKIEELAASILEHGLLQFPVLDEENNLIAGGRRMKALASLGWTTIPIVRKRNVSPTKLREMELEENLQRENLTWQEEIALKNEILRLKQDLYGVKPTGRGASSSTGISQTDVAAMVGDSPSNFSLDVALAKAMEEIPELSSCSSKDEARKKLKQMQEKLIVEELQKRYRKIAEAPGCPTLTSEEGLAQEKPATQSKPSIYIAANESFRIQDAMVGMSELPFVPNLKYINIDTPYGIDLNAIKRDNGGEVKIQESDYKEWAKEDFIDKCRHIAREAYRLADDNCSMTWWFAIQWYQPLLEMLTEEGWKVDVIPNIWDAGEQGQTNQPELYLARCYEPFFSCRKGQPVIFKRGRSNIFRFKKLTGDKKIHPTEKPVELMKELIETYASPGCSILVPFLGSGNDIIAGFQLQHHTFGFDLNNEVKKRFLIRVVEMEREGRL